MSDAVLERRRLRGGQIACVCACEPSAPRPAVASAGGWADLLALGLAHAASVLAQTLAVSVLPVAGAVLAPEPALAALPLGLLVAGAAVATLPAAWLMSGVDRRSGFALGAGLGVAGCGLAAWAIVVGRFPALALAGFWMGLAHGFGLFHRHGAAAGSRGSARAVGLVFGAGASAAVLAPIMGLAARDLAGPLMPALLILGAGAAHVVGLAASLALPAGNVLTPREAHAGVTQDHALSTGVFTWFFAGLAWLCMAALMSGGPVRMVDCELDPAGATGLVAWHVLAMYAPAALAGCWTRPDFEWPIMGLGVAACVAGVALAGVSGSAAGFATAFGLAGAGWSVTTVVATARLHAGAPPSPRRLALNDAALLLAALVGVGLGPLLR